MLAKSATLRRDEERQTKSTSNLSVWYDSTTADCEEKKLASVYILTVTLTFCIQAAWLKEFDFCRLQRFQESQYLNADNNYVTIDKLIYRTVKI